MLPLDYIFMNNISYLLALHSIDGLGPIRLRAVLDYFKDPKLAWEANGSELLKIGIYKKTVDLLLDTRKKLDPQKFMEDMQKMGIKWVSYFDEDYPKLLREIYDPPVILYYKGSLNYLGKKCIAVVGSRKMSGYGKNVTEKFTRVLSDAGLAIVSGLARGVDSQAHKIAIEEGGRTVAVLGGGLNKIYPPENKQLAMDIINGHGAVICEYPPNYPPQPGNFPSRNRIISGLSLAVLVTEAAFDSGSLITAKLALEQGRDVFVVAPNELIKDGAMVVYEPGEILDELGIFKTQNLEKSTEDEKKILEVLQNESLHIDEIGRRLNFESAKTSALLLKMEISGLVQNTGSGNYCRLR